jgi:recombination protein RecT
MAGEVLSGKPMSDAQPLPAASVLVLREPFEVLMLRRHENASFVPSAWVFPGGISEELDADLARELADGSELATMRVTAARETFEETGVWLGDPIADAESKRRRLLAGNLTFRHLLADTRIDLDALVWTSRWITPVGLPRRFDTYFFVASVAGDVEATPEHDEAVEVAWIHPATALAKHAAGEMQMVFPTLRNLEALAGFNSVSELIESRRGALIEPVLPVLVDGRPTLP